MQHTVIVCSICSREKDTNEKLLPARSRYLGSHIALVEQEAQKAELPFFILSGRYGLLAAKQQVPYYDYLLDQNGVTHLVPKLCAQLNTNYIHEVRFYTKNKPAWRLYKEAIEAAASVLDVRLQIKELADDA